MIIEAIKKINPNAEVCVGGTNINTCEIQWLNGTTPISKEDIEAQFPAVELEMAMSNSTCGIIASICSLGIGGVP